MWLAQSGPLLGLAPALLAREAVPQARRISNKKNAQRRADLMVQAGAITDCEADLLEKSGAGVE